MLFGDTIKLINFGFSSDNENVDYFCGTRHYLAPEMKFLTFGETINGKVVDIFALGTMLLMLSTTVEELDFLNPYISRIKTFDPKEDPRLRKHWK
jgi:serine/threonine protein kinase